MESFSLAELASLLWGLASFDLLPETWLMNALRDAALRTLQVSMRVRCYGTGCMNLS